MKTHIEANSPPTIVVFSGAGISAESGISTFRTGEDALWEGYDVLKVCFIGSWIKNFNMVHEFYNARRRDCAAAEPNIFHKTIASWQKDYRVINVTQNVDNLLERAGCNEVIHVHGNIDKMHCTMCEEVWHHEGDWDVDQHCPHCNSVDAKVKPAVVFFGEEAPLYRDMWAILGQLRKGDVLVVAGTSGSVVDIYGVAGETKSKNIVNVFDKTEITEEIRDNFDVVLVGGLGNNHQKITEQVYRLVGKKDEDTGH